MPQVFNTGDSGPIATPTGAAVDPSWFARTPELQQQQIQQQGLTLGGEVARLGTLGDQIALEQAQRKSQLADLAYQEQLRQSDLSTLQARHDTAMAQLAAQTKQAQLAGATADANGPLVAADAANRAAALSNSTATLTADAPFASQPSLVQGAQQASVKFWSDLGVSPDRSLDLAGVPAAAQAPAAAAPLAGLSIPQPVNGLLSPSAQGHGPTAGASTVSNAARAQTVPTPLSWADTPGGQRALFPTMLDNIKAQSAAVMGAADKLPGFDITPFVSDTGDGLGPMVRDAGAARQAMQSYVHAYPQIAFGSSKPYTDAYAVAQNVTQSLDFFKAAPKIFDMLKDPSTVQKALDEIGDNNDPQGILAGIKNAVAQGQIVAPTAARSAFIDYLNDRAQGITNDATTQASLGRSIKNVVALDANKQNDALKEIINTTLIPAGEATINTVTKQSGFPDWAFDPVTKSGENSPESIVDTVKRRRQAPGASPAAQAPKGTPLFLGGIQFTSNGDGTITAPDGTTYAQKPGTTIYSKVPAAQ